MDESVPDAKGERTGLPLAALSVDPSSSSSRGAISHLRNRDGPAHRFGTSFLDLFAHSWRCTLTFLWIWVPKCVCLGELGFPVRDREIRRLGRYARVVKRIGTPPPLKRSFAEVVRGESMDRGRGRFLRRFRGGSRNIGGKRSALEEWMEEDDLLVEEDLRAQLRRDHEQKRKVQEHHLGALNKAGMQSGSQEVDREHFESRNFWGFGRGKFLHGRGWHDDSRFENQGREGGLHRDNNPRGNFQGDLWVEGETLD